MPNEPDILTLKAKAVKGIGGFSGFDESKHPRDDDGKFTDAEGGAIPSLGGGKFLGTKKQAQKGINWTTNLSAEQSDAMNSWQGAGYDSMRKLQADGKSTPQLKNFEAAVAKAPTWDGPAYRGMSLSNKSMADIQPGKTMVMKAHSSFSKDHGVALDFADGMGGGKGTNQVLLRVKGKAMKDISVSYSWLKKGSTEHEVLATKGTKFKIKSVRKNKRGLTIVDLQ